MTATDQDVLEGLEELLKARKDKHLQHMSRTGCNRWGEYDEDDAILGVIRELRRERR